MEKKTQKQKYYLSKSIGISKKKTIFFTLKCCLLKGITEQKARATYEKLIDLCRDNPDVLEPLKFLREREIVHFQRFGEALRGVQDKLAQKKFYMNNMNCMNDNDNNCGCNY